NSHHWYYIPQHEIIKMEHLIQDGDIICLTSVKQDLDVAHQGFAVKKGNRVHLLHASSLAKKVIISGQPLAEYVLAQPGQSGIMVARLN
ncbi:MAG: N-acetylmuramoyl-L-alanine amidase-like domain-containing protein, partial [Bacteroidota bacterium]